MNWLALFAVNLLTCAAQLLQKRAVLQWQGQGWSITRKLSSRWLWGSLLCLGVGLLLWLGILQHTPVSIAYPMLSMNFVLVTLAAHYWFGEATDRQHWMGIGLIILGVCLLGGVL